MRVKAPLIAVLGMGEAGYIHAKGVLGAGARVGVASRRGTAPPFADKVYTDYQSPLDDPEVTGVVIATPYPSHPELVSSAARAGKHICVEKPVAGSLAAAMEARDDARLVRTMVAFMRRYDPAYACAKSRVNDGAYGRPLVLRTLSGDAEYPAKYRRPGGASPGAMWLDLAVHDIDLARWLLNDEVDAVHAHAGALVHEDLAALGDVDTAVATLLMRGGTFATLTLSRALAYGHKVASELVCERGSLDIGSLNHTELVECRDAAISTDVRVDFRERFRDAFSNQMNAFVELCRADDQQATELLKSSSYASYDDGLRATAVAEALVQAAEAGTLVKVRDIDSVSS